MALLPVKGLITIARHSWPTGYHVNWERLKIIGHEKHLIKRYTKTTI